jgi:ergothioneine biosynthesis protein EgtB
MAAVEAATHADLHAPESLSTAYSRARALTSALCEPLQAEDFVVQSMPDASPAKWHLAHTTWFFEQFLLKPHLPSYRAFDPKYEYLFNSYYESLGPMHPRAQRGLLTRPGVHEIYDYREHVDTHMAKLIELRADDDRVSSLSILGLNHEQQHQELLLTDIKHLFSRNPLLPAYRSSAAAFPAPASTTLRFVDIEGGIHDIGATGKHFCFDNETPRHRTLIEAFALADRPILNGEYREFIRAGGYRRPEFWLSDGWAIVKSERWTRPLYWSESLDAEFTLAGEQALQLNAPVCHISYYEADAFARWAGARLPSEAEWEVAAAGMPAAGNLLDGDLSGNRPLHPQPSAAAPGLKQLFGDVWEWTASAYGPYPGFRAAHGALGEYNGKFMCNQLVLRGGSCATPSDHIRATYRNFFYPHARWQFTGLRLAKDL